MTEDPSHFDLQNIIEHIPFSSITGIAILIILLLISAMISGSEIAFFALSPHDLESSEKSNSKKYKLVLKLIKKPKELLATILIANNFINVGIVILSNYLSYSIFKFNSDNILEFFLQIVVITFMILLFGEVIPKVYANLNALRFASSMSKTLNVLNYLLKIFSTPLLKSTSFIENKLQKVETNISVSHLEHALELTSNDSSSSDEQKILEGIVNFGNTDVKQIMCPRIDMFALNINTTFDVVLAEIIKNGYSRIPVFDKNIDNILGILYVKDLLSNINSGSDFDWGKLINPTFFVPENKKIDDLLNNFQEKKVHLAIVVDEYGGTSGLISLEDIIEEIVGDINDEFDIDDVYYSKIDSHNYVFDGKTTLKDFYRAIKLEDESIFDQNKGESDTLAGFILEIAGGFPSKNEEIIFEKYKFTIEAVSRKRIKQIKVTLQKEKI